jgi:hypothetical protein
VDLDQGPIKVEDVLNQLDEAAANELLQELDERTDRLIRTLNRHDMPAEYCEGRFAIIATIVRLIAKGHAECIESAFVAACKWHDSPSLARIPGTFAAIRRIYMELMRDEAFPWERCLGRIFELCHPVRSGEPWGLSRWPDPFEALVTRTASSTNRVAVGTPAAEVGSDVSYELSPLGKTVAARYGSMIANAITSRIGAITVARDVLKEPEAASVMRRITFIDAAKNDAQ